MEWRLFDKRRHWSASSQIYAPADVLLDYLAHGWRISPVVGQYDYWYGGGRHVVVHYFELCMDDQVVVMPVLGNPTVRRIMHHHQLQIVLLNVDQCSALRNKVGAP
jgi:hypothetical protein